MAEDNDARNAVRSLMERFDLVNSRCAALAYARATKDRNAYAKSLAEAERTEETVIRPRMEADAERQQVYAALSDPEANWPAAIMHMLKTTVRYELRGHWSQE